MTILFEKRKMPIVSISANVKEGYAYESEKNKGISHFTEHLMFKGTKTRSYKEIAEEIEKKGGILNAYTDEEITSYWNKIPSKHFSSGIKIVSDLILNPRFDKIEFEKEKKVILEEIKMYRDNPQFYVLNKIKELLYKKPFGMPGTGTIESVSGLSRKELIEFHKKDYLTNKMFLCVVGNTDLEEIENFGKKFPMGKSREKEIKIRKINKKIIETRQGIDQANLVLGFHACSLLDKKRYCYDILNAILAGGMSSRLFEEIREKRGLAYAVRGMLEQSKNYGYYGIYVGTTKENVKKCEELILKEIRKIKSLKRKELEEAREQLIGLRKLESEESVSVMNGLIREEVVGNAEEYYNYEKRIMEVNLEDVRKLGRINNYSFIALVPE